MSETWSALHVYTKCFKGAGLRWGFRIAMPDDVSLADLAELNFV